MGTALAARDRLHNQLRGCLLIALFGIALYAQTPAPTDSGGNNVPSGNGGGQTRRDGDWTNLSRIDGG